MRLARKQCMTQDRGRRLLAVVALVCAIAWSRSVASSTCLDKSELLTLSLESVLVDGAPAETTQYQTNELVGLRATRDGLLFVVGTEAELKTHGSGAYQEAYRAR